MKKVRKPIIIYPRGTAAALSKHWGVSQNAVRKALKFETNSELAYAIRKDCLDNYGGSISGVNV